MPSINASSAPKTISPATPAPQGASPAPATAEASPAIGGDSAQFSSTPPAATAETPERDPSQPAASLTAEEQGFVKQGLLPANYAQLKAIAQSQGAQAAMDAYRQGKKGPFSPSYGNPQTMLSSARSLAQHPQLLAMLKDTQKGDIILIDYNDPKEFISEVTKGPFTHALLCTDAGPPPEFIEATGMTGSQSDPSNNRVRRSGLADNIGPWSAYRKISPADQLPEPQRSQAIDAAVNYAAAQLGKPYDYTFGQTPVGQAFYCSSLAYYAYVKGAKLDIPLAKKPDRDALVEALGSMMNTLQPTDRLQIMSQMAELLNRRPKPSEQEMVNFAITKILPSCNLTAGLAPTSQDQVHLAAAIQKFASGQGMPRYQQASQKFYAAQKAGAFNPPVIGRLRKELARTRIGVAATTDAYHAFDGTGMSRFATLAAVGKLAWKSLPYSEVLGAFAFGQNDGRTRAFGRTLDASEWLKNHWPFSWLPSRGAMRIDNDFISPTDLAWAKLPHQDYNVQAGHSLDASHA